jgi:hypothetical protein
MSEKISNNDSKNIIEKIQGFTKEELVLYDVKEELGSCISENSCKKFEKVFNKSYNCDFNRATPIQRICLYKISSISFDCDVSLFNIMIYKIAYNIAKTMDIEPQQSNVGRIIPNKYKLVDENRAFIGDTMNSYATSIREYLRKYNKNENVYGEKGRPYLKYNCDWEYHILNDYDYFDKLLPDYAKRFIKVNHTIGNFLPVPQCFNVTRANKTMDFWDITLYYIYMWYKSLEKDKCNDSIIKVLCGKTGAYNDENQNLKQYKDWLLSFKTWDNFIEMNYMEDFVNLSKEADKKFGEPKNLWNGHIQKYINSGRKSDLIQQDEKDFEEFFTNASSWIVKRGNRIAEKIKNEIH